MLLFDAPRHGDDHFRERIVKLGGNQPDVYTTLEVIENGVIMGSQSMMIAEWPDVSFGAMSATW